MVEQQVSNGFLQINKIAFPWRIVEGIKLFSISNDRCRAKNGDLLFLGIPFTDPGRLETICNIETNLAKKPELSSQFFYDYFFQHYPMEDFYRKYFIGAVCPLGLEQNGRNMNYYDNKTLLHNLLEHFIPDNLDKQIEIGCSRKAVICLGEGTNYSILNKFNEEHQLFEKIIKVAHPRYIMQYKRKSINDYVEQYLHACQLAERLLLK